MLAEWLAAFVADHTPGFVVFVAAADVAAVVASDFSQTWPS